MSAHADHHKDHVRLSVDCSLEERTYIKMLAAKKHMTISELLAPVRAKIPPGFGREPNDETIEALIESRAKKLKSYKSLDEFWFSFRAFSLAATPLT